MNTSQTGKSYPFLAGLLILITIAAAACGQKHVPVTGTRPAAQSVITNAKIPAVLPAVTTLQAPSPLPPAVGSTVQASPAAVGGWSKTPPCTAGAPCPDLVIAQGGLLSTASGSAQGIQASTLQMGIARPGRWTIDTGLPSPDGKWAAYTSIGNDSGGPVFLQDRQSGAWTNLIEAINAQRPGGSAPLPEDFWWDVIGWFPDSARLMIGPSDLSMVLVVDLATFGAREIGFPGGGLGGRLFVDLAADGSRFLYIGSDAGEQTLSAYDLASGESTVLEKTPYSQGALFNPRFSPDGESIAYLIQKGQPDSGLAYAIDLLSPGQGAARALVEGNLGMTIPAWSPDGRHIAFTRQEGAPQALAEPGQQPQPEPANVWVVSVADGKQAQVTFIPGGARSPVWAKDSQTLAFVTQDGEVGLASLAQPGQMWQAAGPSAGDPALTTVFFAP